MYSGRWRPHIGARAHQGLSNGGYRRMHICKRCDGKGIYWNGNEWHCYYCGFVDHFRTPADKRYIRPVFPIHHRPSIQISCLQCGESMEVADYRTKYCSIKCLREARNDRRRAERTGSPNKRTCGGCGADISNLSPRAKYCGKTCGMRGYRQRRRHMEGRRTRGAL